MYHGQMSSECIRIMNRIFFELAGDRNVIKATIDVPGTGELTVYSTQLDHLDESWRLKQINAMIQSNDQPHLLAGGLNSLDASDYSIERWNDIVKVTHGHLSLVFLTFTLYCNIIFDCIMQTVL